MKPVHDQISSPQTELFEFIQRDSTLVSRVVEQIEGLIIKGQLRPGDLLPPENELARQLGVSRTVIREAMRTLIAKDLLQVRAGSGTVISTPTGKSLAQSMALLLRNSNSELDIDKVVQVRRLLEIEIAALAAERRSAEDLARLEESLDQMVHVSDHREGFAKSDVEFHTALARATHNELFVLLLDSISDVMLEGRRTGFNVPGTPERGLKYHRAIFDQIKAGDPEGARQAMREHLVEAEETLRKAMSLPIDSIDNTQ
jgi:GntR family transcriptional repressor for pyruvate dehydrogenase complex